MEIWQTLSGTNLFKCVFLIYSMHVDDNIIFIMYLYAKILSTHFIYVKLPPCHLCFIPLSWFYIFTKFSHFLRIFHLLLKWFLILMLLCYDIILCWTFWLSRVYLCVLCICISCVYIYLWWGWFSLWISINSFVELSEWKCLFVDFCRELLFCIEWIVS